MRLVAHKTLPKVLGSKASQNEDTFLPQRNGGRPLRRFVMCDGATSSFSGRTWAHSLAKALFAAPYKIEVETDSLFHNDKDFLARIKDDFFRKSLECAVSLYERKFDIAKLSFFKQEAFKRGSAATFLMILQEMDNPDIFHMVAVGDTCCFLITPSGGIFRSFPLSEVSEFSTSAYLVDSRKETQKALFASETRLFFWREATIDLSETPDVRIVCATDAVSQWIIANRDNPCKITKFLDTVMAKSCRAFVKTIQNQRQSGEIAVDDSTVAILEK